MQQSQRTRTAWIRRALNLCTKSEIIIKLIVNMDENQNLLFQRVFASTGYKQYFVKKKKRKEKKEKKKKKEKRKKSKYYKKCILLNDYDNTYYTSRKKEKKFDNEKTVAGAFAKLHRTLLNDFFSGDGS